MHPNISRKSVLANPQQETSLTRRLAGASRSFVAYKGTQGPSREVNLRHEALQDHEPTPRVDQRCARSSGVASRVWNRSTNAIPGDVTRDCRGPN
jgi:hypothetical protein